MEANGPEALVLVDIQQAFDDPYWGARNNPQAEANAGRLLARWRAMGWPVFHVRHASTTPGSPLARGGPGFAFKPEAAPAGDEPVLTKHVNSGFIGTDLEVRLRAAGVERVVIAGLTTPHCVSTTARMAANLGFATRVVADATAAFASSADFGWDGGGPADPEQVHRFALTHLSGEFAQVVRTRELLAEPAR